MIEVWVSKGAAAIANELGYDIASGERTIGMETARDLEHALWIYYKSVGGTPQGRAAASLSRSLATAIEQTRTIEQVHHEIRATLDGKWDDDDAVETQVQLMVHRGWDRTWALRAIRDARLGV